MAQAPDPDTPLPSTRETSLPRESSTGQRSRQTDTPVQDTLPHLQHRHSTSQHLLKPDPQKSREGAVSTARNEVTAPSLAPQAEFRPRSPHRHLTMSTVAPSLYRPNSPEPPSGSHRGRHGRRATACDWCRGRKQGCSRELPCRNCRDHGRGSSCCYTYVAPPVGDPSEQNTSLKPKKRRRASIAGEGEAALDDNRRSLPWTVPSVVHNDTYPQSPSSRLPTASQHAVSFQEAAYVPPTHAQQIRAASEAPGHALNPIRRIGLHVDTEDGGSQYVAPNSRAHKHVQNGNSATARSITMSPELMEESEARGVGSRWAMRSDLGHELEHEKEQQDEERAFFGTSHFGPQLAARVVKGLPSIPLYDIRLQPHRGATIIDETKPYTLVTQVRFLLPHIPRKEACDIYIELFFKQYNSYMDILYQPDFMAKYDRFWDNVKDVRKLSQIDLRQLSLLFIVLAFGILLEHEPAKTEHRLALIETADMSAETKELLNGFMSKVEKTGLSLPERESLSLTWSWAAKKAMSEASSHYGESLDTVRAGALMSLYYVVCRRPTEVWTVIGTTIRAAQAQGMHVDGGKWPNMPPKEAEIRRRLWAQLYIIDRSVSLFLGRPLAIQDDHQTTDAPSNISEDALETPFSEDELAAAPTDSSFNPFSLRAEPLSHPTKTTFLILHHRLASIIGRVQLSCFGLKRRQYRDVQDCEQLFQAFRNELPPQFRLDNSEQDRSFDGRPGYEWLAPQRQTLISKFHLARISLHRPYLLRSFREGREGEMFAESREACVNSAVADIHLRTALGGLDPLDRFKWMTVASGFNPATIIGIICVRQMNDQRFQHHKLLDLLEAYIALEEKTIRRDVVLEHELEVLRMMVRKAKNPSEVVVPAQAPTSGLEQPPPTGISTVQSSAAIGQHDPSPSAGDTTQEYVAPSESASGQPSGMGSYSHPWSGANNQHLQPYAYTFPPPGNLPSHMNSQPHITILNHHPAPPPPVAAVNHAYPPLPPYAVTHYPRPASGLPTAVFPHSSAPPTGFGSISPSAADHHSGSGRHQHPVAQPRPQHHANPYTYMYPASSSFVASTESSTPHIPHPPRQQVAEEWMNHTAWQETAEAFPEDTGDFLEWFKRFTGEVGWTAPGISIDS